MLSVTFTVLGDEQRCADFATLAECSAWYAEQRDAGGYGASDLGIDTCLLPDGRIFRVSYNGRIWNGETLAYDPREVTP